jgi:hypothetical protein
MRHSTDKREEDKQYAEKVEESDAVEMARALQRCN